MKKRPTFKEIDENINSTVSILIVMVFIFYVILKIINLVIQN